ncbi:uncharacterized protein KY384_003846 [Bacidia gigantensis]|uniref:uncharacterized protein n=1 Tax=Bacidia gigantensis TaxID=2732470 RepID=UPI001D03A0D6|nr:uncharacterized protein KY384_003846 [Bacidia gigantensis]KAG8532205.1 hypothetical protein KY384_003846 [Bacidia gigantensis]
MAQQENIRSPPLNAQFLNGLRDWYRSAQEVLVDEAPSPRSFREHDSIIEEGSDEDVSDNGQPNTTAPESRQEPVDQKLKPSKPKRDQESAASELRIHELFALFTCFLSPIIGAWLLHHIRGQLSRPSEGLVSNYNLTIFLLASEIRPLSHLIKLVQARTLSLQRIVASNPYQNSPNSNEKINDLTNRITELESNTSDTQPRSPTATLQQQSDILAATRKSFQPDLDALNRAVRRYEKRATLLTMQTESRLQDLEKKLADAITLAAAAERSSQASKQRRGSTVILEWISAALLLPVQVGWSIISLPGKVLAAALIYVEDAVGVRVRREMKTAGKEKRVGSDGERKRVGRGQKKQS